MKVTRVKLTNWGPHESLDVDMSSGIVGVVGSNGSGKTNFLQAVDFAFTKNLAGRKKETYIRNYGAEDGAKKAVVELWWEKNGKKGHIVRNVTPSGIKSKLEWDEREYIKEADIATCMEEVMGVDKATLVSSIFTKQGCLADLVTGTPGERQSLFFKLLNLTYLDPRASDLAKKIEQLREGIVDYGPALTEVQETIKELIAQLEDYDKEIAAIPDVTPTLKYLNTAGGIHSCIRNATGMIDHYNGSIASLTTELKNICTSAGYHDITDLNAKKFELDTKVSTTNQALQAAMLAEEKYKNYHFWSNELCESQTDVSTLMMDFALRAGNFSHIASERRTDPATLLEAQSEYVTALGDYLTYVQQLEDASRRYEEASMSLADARAKLASAKARKEDPQYKGALILMDACNASIATNENNLKTLRTILDLYNDDGTPAVGSVCPTCHQSIPSKPAEEIKKLKADMDSFYERVEGSRTRLKQTEKKLEDTVEAPIRAAERTLLATEGVFKAAERQLSEATARYSDPAEAVMLCLNRERLLAVGNRQPVPSDIDILNVQIQKERERMRDLRQLGTKMSAAHSRYKTAEDNLAKFGETVTPPKENLVQEIEATLKEATQQLKEVNEAYNSAHATAQAIDKQKQAAAKQYELLEMDQKQLETHLAALPEELTASDVGSVESIRDKSTELMEVKGKRDAMLEQKDNVTRLCASKIQRESELKELIGKNAKKLELVRELSEARAMILKTGTPTLYMNAVFKQMTPIVNKVLADMGANFTVFPDEELPITYKFVRLDTPTGVELPQESLSGGQAIRLALAMLIAVQKSILQDVGLLVLDEPSSHIDAEGVANMATMFSKLGTVLANSETQLIVVDHNPSLIGSFDKKVTLGDTN